MIKLLYASVAAIALTTAAQAADVVQEAPPAPPAPIVATPVFTWSGLYVGGNAGYGWANAAPFDDDGFLGGVQLGYNYEINRLVLGVEGDFDATGMRFFGNDVNYLASVRGRVGLAVNRWMIYGTGGYAYAHASGGLHDGGWVAGGGVEWAMTDHIVPGIEYLHYGFNDFSHTGLDADADVIRVRLSYKF